MYVVDLVARSNEMVNFIFLGGRGIRQRGRGLFTSHVKKMRTGPSSYWCYLPRFHVHVTLSWLRSRKLHMWNPFESTNTKTKSPLGTKPGSPDLDSA